MWGLWFVPLMELLLIIGIVFGVLWLFFSPQDRRTKIITAVAFPFGCAAVPVIGLLSLAAIGSFFQKSDTQLYEEIFGYRPTITEDRMLFDDFGDDEEREIFMRAEPTEDERKKLMAIPELALSGSTADEFIARAEEKGLGWWVSTNSALGNYCKKIQIYGAVGFRGWKYLHMAECVDGGGEFPASTNRSFIYVIVSGRQRLVDQPTFRR